jgi:hypothetical protein
LIAVLAPADAAARRNPNKHFALFINLMFV